jgi:hypothetical protein
MRKKSCIHGDQGNLKDTGSNRRASSGGARYIRNNQILIIRSYKRLVAILVLSKVINIASHDLKNRDTNILRHHKIRTFLNPVI